MPLIKQVLIPPGEVRIRSYNAGKNGTEFNPKYHDSYYHTAGQAVGKIEQNPKTAAGLALGAAALPFAGHIAGAVKNFTNPGIVGQATRFAAKHPVGTAVGLGGAGLLAGRAMSGGRRND